jgi:acetyl esterase/lipase
MSRQITFCILVLTALITPVGRPQSADAEHRGPITLRLWPGTPPGVSSPTTSETREYPTSAWVANKPVLILGNVSEPTATFYPPKAQENGQIRKDGYPVVIVFPGGGYNILAYDLEGTEICDWLNHIGVACVLLKYRVPNTGPYPKSEAALQDAQRAVGLVRQHTSDWKINAAQVGVLGFSAGGHLAAALVSHSVSRLYPAVDSADDLSCRPDFQILIYPAYLSATDESLDLAAAVQPPANGPPTFLVQTENDHAHVENAIAYFEASKRKGISAEMHLYATGGHGYGLRASSLPVTTWTVSAAHWLESIGIPLKLN